MSRTKAKEMLTWDVAQRFLRERGVTLLSAGLDESANGLQRHQRNDGGPE